MYRYNQYTYITNINAYATLPSLGVRTTITNTLYHYHIYLCPTITDTRIPLSTVHVYHYATVNHIYEPMYTRVHKCTGMHISTYVRLCVRLPSLCLGIRECTGPFK